MPSRGINPFEQVTFRTPLGHTPLSSRSSHSRRRKRKAELLTSAGSAYVDDGDFIPVNLEPREPSDSCSSSEPHKQVTEAAIYLQIEAAAQNEMESEPPVSIDPAAETEEISNPPPPIEDFFVDVDEYPEPPQSLNNSIAILDLAADNFSGVQSDPIFDPTPPNVL